MTEKQMIALLKSYAGIKASIKEKNQELMTLKDVIEAQREVTGIVYSNVRLSKTNITSDETFKKAERIIDIYDKHLDRISGGLEELFEEKLRIEGLLDCLDEVERRIIQYKYFDGLSMRKINIRVCYSNTQCYRIHDGAIKKLIENHNAG